LDTNHTTTPRVLARFDEISSDYDAVLCDLWGVVHDGVRAFEAACAALVEYRASGGRVVLVSNVPKPCWPIPSQLDRLGVPRAAWDSIVTSGDATRAVLATRAPGPAHLIGPLEDASLWDGLGLQFSAVDEAAFLVVTGLEDFFEGQPEQYRERLDAGHARELDLVCANPDIVVRHGDRLVWCAGALARDYAALGGRVVHAGKPHPPIYALAREELRKSAGRIIAKGRTLVIGDGLATDIRGANSEGYDALFVASGIHSAELEDSGALDHEKLLEALRASGATARYAMPALD